MDNKNIWICILSGVILLLVVVILNQRYDYKDAIDTKDHFVDSLRECLNEKDICEEQLRRCYDGYNGWTDDCKFKGRISIENEYVSNWIRTGFVCNIHKIVNKTIECYECP